MKVKFGLKNVYFAVLDETTNTYETPVALPGAVNLSIDVEGEQSNFAADDNPKYFSKFVNNGYSGSLEVALLNEAFLTTVLGQTKDSNGAIIENKNDSVKPFALLFEVSGDTENRRTVFYKVTASRPSTEAGTTEDSIEVKTETINITCAGNSAGDIKATLDQGATGYDTFFSSVYVKNTGSI